jgi:predicted dehydrogenase
VEFSWRKEGRFDTDIVLDLATHPISVAYHLVGTRPRTVRVSTARTVVSSTDLLSATLGFDGDRTCEIRLNRAAPEAAKSLLVKFADGTAYTWTDEALYRLDGEEYVLTSERSREPLRVECERFVEATEHGTTPITDGEFGYVVSDVAERIRTRIRPE